MEDQIQDQLLRIKGFLDVLGLSKGLMKAYEPSKTSQE